MDIFNKTQNRCFELSLYNRICSLYYRICKKGIFQQQMMELSLKTLITVFEVGSSYINHRWPASYEKVISDSCNYYNNGWLFIIV